MCHITWSKRLKLKDKRIKLKDEDIKLKDEDIKLKDEEVTSETGNGNENDICHTRLLIVVWKMATAATGASQCLPDT